MPVEAAVGGRGVSVAPRLRVSASAEALFGSGYAGLGSMSLGRGKLYLSLNCGAVRTSRMMKLQAPELQTSDGRKNMKKLIQGLVRCQIWKDTRGQDLVEYALLAGFITVAAMGIFPPVSTSISTIFSKVQSLLQQV